MKHKIACRCGTLKGYVDCSGQEIRGICYCSDCQAFAKYLGQEANVLDSAGGTDVIQTSCEYIQFTEGKDALVCLKLTERGILRWYSNCCKTPICNTLSNYKISFVGLLSSCLEDKGQSVGSAFGPIKMRVHTKSAASNPKPRAKGVSSAIIRISGMLLRARLLGGYKRTPFFDINTGDPVIKPKLLTAEELKRLKINIDTKVIV